MNLNPTSIPSFLLSFRHAYCHFLSFAKAFISSYRIEHLLFGELRWRAQSVCRNITLCFLSCAVPFTFTHLTEHCRIGQSLLIPSSTVELGRLGRYLNFYSSHRTPEDWIRVVESSGSIPHITMALFLLWILCMILSAPRQLIVLTCHCHIINLCPSQVYSSCPVERSVSTFPIESLWFGQLIQTAQPLSHIGKLNYLLLSFILKTFHHYLSHWAATIEQVKRIR